jgi:hypothetical protein
MVAKVTLLSKQATGQITNHPDRLVAEELLLAKLKFYIRMQF